MNIRFAAVSCAIVSAIVVATCATSHAASHAASGKLAIGQIPRSCSSAIAKLKRQADDAHIVADESKERILRQRLAISYYRCATSLHRNPNTEHLYQILMLRYSQSLYASLLAPLDSNALDRLHATLAPLSKSRFSDVRNESTRLLDALRKAAPQPTANPALVCEKSGFKAALVQWESDFATYAKDTDASSLAYNQALQQSRNTTYVPSSLSPGWQNALYDVSATAQNAANQRAATTVRAAYATERQALSAVVSDAQSVFSTAQAIHGSGESQTEHLGQRMADDVQAITQYSQSFTAEGHLGQAGVDDLNHIKASKLDYDDAARQLLQLPYCSK
ncbi:MAG: hypothetical protein PXZ07_04405 [Candidatus Eremiobacteraeota bacterium]|nr:hypothetical protein [Candidatus Eremiobacteraeota bacterium]